MSTHQVRRAGRSRWLLLAGVTALGACRSRPSEEPARSPPPRPAQRPEPEQDASSVHESAAHDAASTPFVAADSAAASVHDAEPAPCGRKGSPGARDGRCLEGPERPIDPNEF